MNQVNIKCLVSVDPRPIVIKERRKMLIEQGASTWMSEGSQWFDQDSRFIGIKGKVQVRISELADMKVDEFVNLLLSVKNLS